MITDFMERNFRHFNARETLSAARAYKAHVDSGNLMMVTLGGAMSTAELGVSLAEMIRKDKVHIISCTGANLEESLFNLVARGSYEVVPDYRNLRTEDEQSLYERGYNRVTDTCIPEEEAFRHIEHYIAEEWRVNYMSAKAAGVQLGLLPHQFFYNLLDRHFDELPKSSSPDDCWLVAAWEKDLPIVVPGWEDSTLGNIFAGYCLKGELEPWIVANGITYMVRLAHWYQEVTKDKSVGFFQIGGGIAGDFPICVVPMLHQDMELDVSKWGYFCQISDSTTSYGSYSGAHWSEKITWGKLTPDTPAFCINSDATVVAPLIFNYVLGK
jgi:deoxyhypusine synthase